MNYATKILISTGYATKYNDAGLIEMPDGTLQKVEPMADTINGLIQREVIKHYLAAYGICRYTYYATTKREVVSTREQAEKLFETFYKASQSVGWFATGEKSRASGNLIMMNFMFLKMQRNGLPNNVRMIRVDASDIQGSMERGMVYARADEAPKPTIH